MSKKIISQLQGTTSTTDDMSLGQPFAIVQKKSFKQNQKNMSIWKINFLERKISF